MSNATTAPGFREFREPGAPLYTDPVHHAPIDPTRIEAPDGTWRVLYT
ncbi:hypothetical protein [Streptomyces sp. 8K308]|nr:hypothetical protein [Streptomyces sp. 8K308]